MRIAVIIPTLNECRCIANTVCAVKAGGSAAHIVVADCNSTDRTRDLAVAAGAEVICGDKLSSRASAMNQGAQWVLEHVPEVDVLWFLHADTFPPLGWDEAIAAGLQMPDVVGGALDFRWELDGIHRFSRVLLMIISMYNRVRMRVTKSFYGDQGIFIRTKAFTQVGGFPDVLLLEDVVICRQLKRIGRLTLARRCVITSPRRFQRHGIIRQALIDGFLLAAERIGIHPMRLQAWYNREKA